MTNVTLAQTGKKHYLNIKTYNSHKNVKSAFFEIWNKNDFHTLLYDSFTFIWQQLVELKYDCLVFSILRTSCLSSFHSPLPPLVNRESKLRFFPAVLWQMMMARCNLGKEYAPQLMESSALWDEYRALWETEANCTTLTGKCLSQRLSDSAAPSRSSLNEWLLLLWPFYWPGKGREKKKTCRSSHSLQNKWRY